MKRIILSLLLIAAGLSCDNNEDKPLKKVLLRSKEWFNSIKDSIHLVTYKYEYGYDNRLIRINYCKGETDSLFAYETFQFNSEGNPEFKLKYSFANDSIGWVLNDSTSFEYENGLLNSEQVFYPPTNSYAESFYFEYENSLIVEKNRYDNQEFSYCIQYDYSNNFCTKETRFSDAEFKSLSGCTIHHYENDLRIRSDVLSSQNQMIQIITCEYDHDRKLILEVSVKTDFTVVAPLEYVYRYEYC